jgi:hypothetical protein
MQTLQQSGSAIAVMSARTAVQEKYCFRELNSKSGAPCQQQLHLPLALAAAVNDAQIVDPEGKLTILRPAATAAGTQKPAKEHKP